MPTYNSIITQTDAAALIPEDVADEVIRGATEQSAALRLFRTKRMSARQQRLPVLSALPTAYFVTGETGLKQTTEEAWANKFLNVEEIACLVPVPDALVDDADFDLWGEIRPDLTEAVGRALDAAIFFGADKPASWPTAIATAAATAGNVRVQGTATQAQGGIAEDLNQLMGSVEADGFDVNGFVADRSFRRFLRGARATDGQKIADMNDNTIEGSPVAFAMSGLWPTAVSTARMFAGDFTQGIVGIRQDMTFKISTEGVVQDGTGAILYNALQQDLSIMRVVFRVAFQVANPITRGQAVEAQRYPFGVLNAPAT